ncbi:probable transporter (major facilitator superfamily) [Phialocephala subalpina]|uniref:Probable transporter (Major facilitator superfamily) n=1 Tax=Phialocephala subalpina TaxID=576137 RepID=A0A1L7XDG9_9HELO|nr:probable transporter (major facilitator superfamily) [Phialocephala subalpina]
MSSHLAIPETSLWANRKCLLLCCLVATANMQYGFDSAAVGALQAMPGFLKVFSYEDPSSALGYGIDSTVQQLITSLLTLGSFVSSLIAGFFSAYLGRKHALWLACVFNAVGVAIQMATTSKGVLYLGPEASPTHLRGIMVALFAYWVNIGSILGAVVDNFTRIRLDKASYQIPLGFLFIVPTVLAVVLFFVPGSPRWLLHKGRDEQARKALETLRGNSVDNKYIELEWAEMLRGVEEEKNLAKSIGFLDIFRGTDLRRTLLCYGMIACQTASGVWFLIGYQTYFLSIAGITKSFEFSIMNTCIGFIGVKFGMYAIRHVFGRRSILMIGATACGLSQLASAIAYTVKPGSTTTGDVLVAFTAVFMFFYNGCVGSASYPVATELVSSRLRAWSVGTATSIGYILAWLVGFCSPYFINPQDLNWGPKYGYIWAGSNAVCVLFFFFFMPEMKGRSPEELDEIFNARTPAWKFKSFQCTIKDEAAFDMQEKIGMRIEKEGGIISNEVEDVQRDNV